MCDSIRNLFHRNDLRCTRQREVLFGVLASSKTHPTAEELFQQATHADPELSLATVYNALEAFCAAGLARRVGSPLGGPCRYDPCTHDHAHVTTSDGRVLDVPDDLSRRLMSAIPEQVLRELSDRMGVRIERLEVQVHAAVAPAEPVTA